MIKLFLGHKCMYTNKDEEIVVFKSVSKCRYCTLFNIFTRRVFLIQQNQEVKDNLENFFLQSFKT